MSFFDSLLGSAAGPIGALGGAAISGGLSYLGGQQANAQAQQNTQSQFFNNLALQQQAEQFNAQQNATKYQTAVKDMRAAGLNPILAAGGVSASGASIGGGSVGAAPVTNSLAGAVSSAQQGSKLTSEVSQIAAQIGNIVAQTDNTKTDTQNKQIENNYKPAVLQSLIDTQTAQQKLNSAQGVAALSSSDLSEAQVNKVVQEIGLTDKYGRSPSLTNPETIGQTAQRVHDLSIPATAKAMGAAKDAASGIGNLVKGAFTSGPTIGDAVKWMSNPQ